MDLNNRLRYVIRNKLETSLEKARKRGFKIGTQEFVTDTHVCAFGAVFVIEKGLFPNINNLNYYVSAFDIVDLLALPLEVVDAFLDGFDYKDAKVSPWGYRGKNGPDCYFSFRMGCQFNRDWVR